MNFQQKTKKNLKILFVPKWPETYSRHNLQFFHHARPSNQVKRPNLAFFERFSHFWWLLLWANFRGYSKSERPVSQLNMKIKVWALLWVPSVHFRKGSAYPLKLRLKNFWFFNNGIFGHFCSDLSIVYNKYPIKWHFVQFFTVVTT